MHAHAHAHARIFTRVCAFSRQASFDKKLIHFSSLSTDIKFTPLSSLRRQQKLEPLASAASCNSSSSSCSSSSSMTGSGAIGSGSSSSSSSAGSQLISFFSLRHLKGFHYSNRLGVASPSLGFARLIKIFPSFT